MSEPVPPAPPATAALPPDTTPPVMMPHNPPGPLGLPPRAGDAGRTAVIGLFALASLYSLYFAPSARCWAADGDGSIRPPPVGQRVFPESPRA